MSVTLLLLSAALAGSSLPDRLAARATQPDVTLVPPVGEPSPPAGSFLIPYTPEEGQEADPKQVGTFEVGPSSCSAALKFKEVSAAEDREELWLVDSGVGARLGLPQFGVKVGGSTKSVAGIKYKVDTKLIVDTESLAALESCCLTSPDKCTERYISEYWLGTGTIHRMTGTDAVIKTSLKQLDKLGQIDFGVTKGWSMSSNWDKPMYFAYRVAKFQLPSCQTYMNNLEEQEGQVLFTGVSARVSSEQAARRDARQDARQQIVRYLGEELKISGDEIESSAEALLSGVKDSLTCLDDTTESPEGPQYLARVRMYVGSERLKEAAAEMRSGSK